MREYIIQMDDVDALVFHLSIIGCRMQPLDVGAVESCIRYHFLARIEPYQFISLEFLRLPQRVQIYTWSGPHIEKGCRWFWKIDRFDARLLLAEKQPGLRREPRQLVG